MERKLTPLKAIRLKCIDCCCGSKTEVKLCVFDGQVVIRNGWQLEEKGGRT